MIISLIKKIFGSAQPAKESQAPYKIETPPETAKTDWPFPVGTAQEEAKPAVEQPKKKPAAKKATGSKKPAVKAKTARSKKTTS